MADPLYLSLWFPRFEETDMMPRLLSVTRLFLFSESRPGITAISVHPVSWSEPTILERRFRPGIAPEQAIAMAADMLHEDYAYLLEAYWDLWVPGEGSDEWIVAPRQVKFIAHGVEFDEGTYEESGHIQVDFGLDSPFLFDDVDLNQVSEPRVRANVQKLINFSNALEKNAGITARVLWSESEENLAQKLIQRLQKTH
ncbi:MAG TPA: hypothetical protein VI216_02775 [Candidatus Acidoferrales bacterium]|jgi:hypothetical protein